MRWIVDGGGLREAPAVEQQRKFMPPLKLVLSPLTQNPGAATLYCVRGCIHWSFFGFVICQWSLAPWREQGPGSFTSVLQIRLNCETKHHI